jgi:hypothetical protein
VRRFPDASHTPVTIHAAFSEETLMKTLFDPETHREILDRLDRLTPETSRRWGTMAAGKMICHLADHLRTALGDLDAGSGGGPMTWAPVKWFAIEVMPWPHGLPTAPAMLTTDPEDFARDVAELKRVIARFLERGPEGAFHPHPLFGPLTGAQWGRLAYRHLDHHLRQFGG